MDEYIEIARYVLGEFLILIEAFWQYFALFVLIHLLLALVWSRRKKARQADGDSNGDSQSGWQIEDSDTSEPAARDIEPEQEPEQELYPDELLYREGWLVESFDAEDPPPKKPKKAPRQSKSKQQAAPPPANTEAAPKPPESEPVSQPTPSPKEPTPQSTPPPAPPVVEQKPATPPATEQASRQQPSELPPPPSPAVYQILRAGAYNEKSEQLIAVFRTNLYQIEQIIYEGRFGMDFVVSKLGARTLVNAKWWKKKVGERVVQAAIEGSHHHRCDFAVVVSPKGFNRAAKKLAKAHSVALWDNKTLAREEKNARKGKIESGQLVAVTRDR